MDGFRKTSKDVETGKEARLIMMELANMISVPMSLNAVVNLKVADVIWQGGSNTPLSASEILPIVVPSGNGDVVNFERILRMLASYGVFQEHVSEGQARKFSVTEVGKTLVSDSNGHSFGAYVLQHHQDALMKAWNLVHRAVEDSSKAPFEVANGIPAYDFYGLPGNEEYNKTMLEAMTGLAIPFMNALLEGYDGFDGVQSVVDVGGSMGTSVGIIKEKHPAITAISFDTEYVTHQALEDPVPGVTYVAGDMFVSVPAADVVFMRWMISTWNDEESVTILKNCYAALPEGGKLVLCEPENPENTDDSHRTRALLEGNIFIMTIYKATGEQRTKEEYVQLGLKAGFKSYNIYPTIDYFWTVFEFLK